MSLHHLAVPSHSSSHCFSMFSHLSMTPSILRADRGFMLLHNFFQSGQFLRDLGINSTPPQLLLISSMSGRARNQSENTQYVWGSVMLASYLKTVLLPLFYLVGASEDSWASLDSSTEIVWLDLLLFCAFNTLPLTWTWKKNKGKENTVFFFL